MATCIAASPIGRPWDTSDNVWRDLRKVRHKSYRYKTSKCDATLTDIPQDQAFKVDAENISKFRGKMSVVYRVRIDILPPMLNHFALLNCAVSRD